MCTAIQLATPWTSETEAGFGIEVHHKPYIDLKLLIEDGNFATIIMKELSEMDNCIKLG